MSGFSIDWLDLREDADRRARDSSLREQALQWLTGEGRSASAPLVVDLGAGTGSTLRALGGSGQQRLNWRLVDHDQTLLEEARRRHGATHVVEACVADLSPVEALPLAGARLVTASALFDLVSSGFVESLATVLKDQCRQSPVGLYAALNYDGATLWTPPHPLDEPVLQAFNRDQRTDKGFGPALGPQAGPVMEAQFRRAGFEVYTAVSPWVLGATDQGMVSALIDGIASAVAGSSGLDSGALRDWVRFRHDHAATGTCTVGHTDLLVLPGRG
ncbi:class I SAM-dependent methyltransferase [Saccharospirillum impatiens]|uniref:class I SAM-dependent methyltransferase n=1 Tax=Saccharospirillum impatiens TaxID=169438 RepID=UPI000424D527|nr:class I SAM-dependent methyltransferase [Saccharospirillum impatiens]